MYFTDGGHQAFERLMRGKPGFDHYDSGAKSKYPECGTCAYFRPRWRRRFCVYEECPYAPGRLTATDKPLKGGGSK